MAIDEKIIGEVRPSGSAVDRLRKRIRPWESSLVASAAEQKTETQGVGNPPPEQSTERVRETGGPNPVGKTPSGSPIPGVEKPVGEKPSLDQQKCTSPLGNPPSGSLTLRAKHPVGNDEFQAYEKEGRADSSPPSGSDALRSNHPLGKLPTGSENQCAEHPVGVSSGAPGVKQASSGKPTGGVAQGVRNPEGNLPCGLGTPGDIPSGRDTSQVNDPVGNSREPVVQKPDPKMSLAQGVDDPEGGSPSGQISAESRIQQITGFDPSAFVPPDKGEIVWREKGSGELRIPHRLYEFAHRVTSTRNELLVFDCLLRFSLGFHRSWCEAGYSFIGAWTGINDVTNIKKSLKTLIESGLVVKTKQHDSSFNIGTFYEVPVVKSYLEYVAIRKEQMSNKETAKEPLGDLPSGRLTPGGETPSGGGRETQGGVGDLPTKKENLNKNLKKTPSQSVSEDLDAYVDQIKPASKRESEIHFLGKLLSEYTSQDVSIALLYVQKFGVLGSKEQCHSPIKYLSTAMEQVLPKAREYQQLLRFTENGAIAKLKTEQPTPEEESAQKRLRDKALQAFESQLSQEERDRLLAEVTKQNSVKGYAPPLFLLRTMAALEWYTANSGVKVVGNEVRENPY